MSKAGDGARRSGKQGHGAVNRAPKRLIWKREQVTLGQILSWKEDQDCFDRLSVAGFRDDLLESLLVTFANGSEAPFQLIPGRSRKAIRGFIDRIWTLAGEIEAANKSAFFDPSQCALSATSAIGKPIAPAYSELPSSLRLYCKHLTMRMGMFRRTGNTRRDIKAVFPALARRFTGTPHFEDCAKLLTAALKAADEHDGHPEVTVSAESLLQLEKDHQPEIASALADLDQIEHYAPAPKTDCDSPEAELGGSRNC
jgi:hypothetical protein